MKPCRSHICLHSLHATVDKACLTHSLYRIHHLLDLLVTLVTHHALFTATTQLLIIHGLRLLNEVKGATLRHHDSVLATHHFVRLLLRVRLRWLFFSATATPLSLLCIMFIIDGLQ